MRERERKNEREREREKGETEIGMAIERQTDYEEVYVLFEGPGNALSVNKCKSKNRFHPAPL